ncbi:ATP-dependent DNA helicase PIF1-like [Aphis craccivora]|uniref:ATP-dependent DNA helicase PIF1-like n=1 Tax=Aphis craccivora TaxID=307492 RepID=A0A6G0WJ35_APHCR|nr:ATP-dependent DNA helicase PIF1-like [Aphis craccivora]
MTIHKSQGGTFPEIVYEYDKKHSQQLLYVALSISSKNDFKLYHGRRYNPSMSRYYFDKERLINCQGLQSHAADIIDSVSSVCNFLLISETNLSEEQSMDIPHFN